MGESAARRTIPTADARPRGTAQKRSPVWVPQKSRAARWVLCRRVVDPALGVDRCRRAQLLLEELEARDRNDYVPATALARVHNSLGTTDRALDLLERVYSERDVRMAFFTASGSLKSLRDHPRFRALVQRIETEGQQADRLGAPSRALRR